MLKDFTLSLELEPTENRVVQTAAIFWSHDVNTAKIYIELLRKGTPIILNKGVTVRVMMLFDDENKSEHIYTAKIEDELKGLVSITLEESMRMYVGQVTCGVYVDYQNEEKTDNGYFTFGMRRSLIDKDMPELQKLYVSDFEKALESFKEFDSRLDDMKEHFDGRYDETKNDVEEIEQLIESNDIVRKEEHAEDISRIEKKIYNHYINVASFADENGDFNSGCSIQKAIDYAYQKNINKVFIPAGVYNLDKPLLLHSSSINLIGVWNKTILVKNNDVATNRMVKYTVGGVENTYFYDKPSVIDVLFPENSYSTYIDIRNIVVDGSENQVGINAPRIAHSNFDNLILKNCTEAFISETSWMNTFTNIRSINSKEHFVVKSGTSNKISRWHVDGGFGSSVGFRITNLVYSNMDNCGADRVNTAYVFDGHTNMTLTGCGTEVWSRSVHVRGKAEVTFISCFLEAHITQEGQTAHPWIFGENSNSVFTGGEITFKNYTNVSDISGFSVPDVQDNARLTLQGTKLDYEQLVKRNELFSLAGKSVVKNNDNVITRNKNTENILNKRLFGDYSKKKEIFRIKNVKFNDIISLTFDIKGFVQRSDKSFGYALFLSGSSLITYQNGVKADVDMQHKVSYYDNDFKVKITPKITHERVDNDYVFFLENVSEDTDIQPLNPFDGYLFVKSKGANGDDVAGILS